MEYPDMSTKYGHNALKNDHHNVLGAFLESEKYFIHPKIDVQSVRKHDANKIKSLVNTISFKL